MKKHPNNYNPDNIYIPVPPIKKIGKIKQIYRTDHNKLSNALFIIYTKYQFKLKNTLWLVEWDEGKKTNKKGKVQFRYYTQVFNFEFNSLPELETWLNFQLLKHIGITLSMYWLFYECYSREYTKENDEVIHLWQ